MDSEDQAVICNKLKHGTQCVTTRRENVETLVSTMFQ